MKKLEVRLNRLFAAARNASPADEAAPMPGYLQTRVLAHWRATAADDIGRGLALMFRGALAGAALVMLVSIAWSFGELAYDPQNDVAVANYELRDELRGDVMP